MLKIMVLTDDAHTEEKKENDYVYKTACKYVGMAIKGNKIGDVLMEYDHPLRVFGRQITCDAVVVDYGGMSLGQGGFADHVSREFAKAIQDYPNTNFFLVSEMYCYDIREEIQKWYDGEGTPHNYFVGWDSFYQWLKGSKTHTCKQQQDMGE